MSDKHKISICFFNDREMRGNDANPNLKQKTLSGLATLTN